MKTYLIILFICLCGFLSIHNTTFAMGVGGSEDVVCGKGQYSVLITVGDFVLGNQCLDCAAGTFSLGSTDGTINTNPTSCTACSAGSYSAAKAGSCTSCSAGTFNSATNETSCTPCTAGSVSATGATSCTTCPAGSSANSDQSACLNNSGQVVCNAGSYSADGTTCTACPAGSVSESAGATSCTTCPAGSSANSDQTACVDSSGQIISSQKQPEGEVTGGGTTCNLHKVHENLSLFSILFSFGFPFSLLIFLRRGKTVLGN